MSDPYLEHLSYSSISTYLNCGMRWKLRYVDKIPAVPSSNLIFGTAWHKTVEEFVVNSAMGLDVSLADTWIEQWASKVDADEECDWQDSREDLFSLGLIWATSNKIALHDGHESMSSLLRAIKPKRTQVGFIYDYEVEKKVYLSVPDVGVPIIGYIDILTEDDIPIDIKTSARSWSKNRAQDELQPLFYLAALAQKGVVVPGNTFMHYVFIKNSANPSVQIIKTERQEGEIKFLFDVIQSVWAGISSGVFVENPTAWNCNSRYCDYWSICRGKYL